MIDEQTQKVVDFVGEAESVNLTYAVEQLGIEHVRRAINLGLVEKHRGRYTVYLTPVEPGADLGKERMNGLTQENLGSTTVLIPLVETAAREHNWRVIASVEMPPASGLVQHGYMMVDRGHSPFGEGRIYATLCWCRRADGTILFEQGHYDLTREAALSDLAERARIK